MTVTNFIGSSEKIKIINNYLTSDFENNFKKPSSQKPKVKPFTSILTLL